MTARSYNTEDLEPYLRRVERGEATLVDIQREIGVTTGTLLAHMRKLGIDRKLKPKAAIKSSESPPAIKSPPNNSMANILIYDIETLPNRGYFFDTYSDRAIPLEFIDRPKSICTIAYKWYGQQETYVLAVDEPYDDKKILEAFLPEWSKADYVVAHYSRFDKPFIAARLMANSLPSLPPVNDICTYKLAKAHFGRSLNGNKLDHLGTILGVGQKIKTKADLWVRCAEGKRDAIDEMATYNKQDVDLLSEVFRAMLPYVRSKLNLNLMTDEPVLRCKQCGGDNMEQRGYEYSSSAMRHRYLCNSCGSWSSFSQKKGLKP